MKRLLIGKCALNSLILAWIINASAFATGVSSNSKELDVNWILHLEKGYIDIDIANHGDRSIEFAPYLTELYDPAGHHDPSSLLFDSPSGVLVPVVFFSGPVPQNLEAVIRRGPSPPTVTIGGGKTGTVRVLCYKNIGLIAKGNARFTFYLFMDRKVVDSVKESVINGVWQKN